MAPPPSVTVDSDSFVAEEPAQEVPEPIEIKFSKALNLDLQGLYYPDKLSPHVNYGYGFLKGELNTSLRVGRGLLFKFRPTGTVDPGNKSVSEQYYADVPEGYAQYRHSLGDIATSYTQVGWNTFTWGVTDGYNPVDVVNARRFHDPLRSEKLGAFSIVQKLDFDTFLLEGIYIPQQRRSMLPGSNSRWLPRDLPPTFRSGDAALSVPTTPAHYFYFLPDHEYDSAREHNFGLRAGLKALGIDMGGYFFQGASVVPGTSLALQAQGISIVPPYAALLNPPIGIRPLYYKNNVFGGTMVFPVSDFLVRVAAAYTEPTHASKVRSKAVGTKLPVLSREAVFELEHTISGETQSVTLIGLLTYAQHVDPSGDTSSTSLTRMFDRGIALGARYQPMEGLTAEMFAVADTKYGGQLYKGEITKTLNDLWKVYGGGEVFAGKNTTPIGVYRKNDRAWAGVRLAL